MKTRVLFFLLCFLLIRQTGEAQNKYAIGLFHFNLQYVAGDYRIENRIINESLYPVLQFFEKHPRYKSDIEIQGYAIEVLAEDHPNVLKLLKKLVERKQIELVIAHYSDQFFIGYPALDLQKSIELSDEILAQNGLKRSRVFFGQEIQWTPAYASILKRKYDLVVTSSDPHNYYRGKTPPLVRVNYGDDAILALIGAGDKQLNGLDWEWAFLDDGEVFNTTDYRSDFYRVPEQEKKHIDKFKKLEKDGYQFVTMSELAEKIKNSPDYQIPDYPFVPEGTWNMSVCGPFMWMGKQRSGVETDGITRAASYKLRGILLMTGKLIQYASSLGMDVSQLNELLKQAWKHLLLSEVSDSSGWTPLLVEVQYTDNEVADAYNLIDKILGQLNGVLPKEQQLLVNTQTVSVAPVHPAKPKSSAAAALPIPFTVLAKRYEARIRQLGDTTLFQLDLKCSRPENGAVEIIFDTPPNGLFYSAGAGENLAVEIPTDLKKDPAFSLSNGFIYLNNGYSLIKDCSVEHLAAKWLMKDQKLVFREELREGNKEMNMRFYLLKGSVKDGLDFANKLNTWPSYLIRNANGKINFEKINPSSAYFNDPATKTIQ